MKKVIMFVAVLALLAGTVNAGPSAYIGIFTDDAHQVCSQAILAPYAGWTSWIWVLPSDNGMMCAEFMVQNPAWLLNISTTVNPAHSVALGDVFTGISICFASCQNEWTWLYQLGALPTVAGVPDYQQIVAHPAAGAYQVANCLSGYPLEPVIILNNLALNQDCLVGNENASWGAIKGMYSE